MMAYIMPIRLGGMILVNLNLFELGFNNMAEKITNQPNYWVRLKLYREMLERERGYGIAFKTLPKHVTDKRIRREIEMRYKRKECEEML